MRLTAKERILLHLLESAHSSDDPEVPAELAQEGVARSAGIEVRHVAQFVRPLVQEGLVRERMAHVTGIRQRRKVCYLTHAGRISAIRLREKVKMQVVRIREGDAVREESLDQALQGVGARASLLEAVRQVQDAGILDLETVAHPPVAGLIEQLWGAPRIGMFVGRRKELAEVTGEDDGPRIFVVRGMAGIGKSYFAARACELVRGRRNLFWHRVRPWETSQTILAALGRFLEALDRPGLVSILKRGNSGLAAEVLRQDLPDTRSFLVFDDAHEASPEAAIVFRMLAEAVATAPGVRVLVLTRRSLAFYDVRDVAIESDVREIELGRLEPDEVLTLLTDVGESGTLAGLGRRFAGHPLLLELVRKRGSDVPTAIRDMQRFLEEAVYQDLSGPERATMKAAAFYRVPVPRAALLALPGASHDALLSLRDRSLIRLVGGDLCEIHDTIRDFFDGILTPEERRKIGPLAVAELRELAHAASASGNHMAAFAYASNALRIVDSPDERAALSELLGDTSRAIGDALAMSTAYREALRRTREEEATARLHRKMASAFEEWGQYNATATEMEAAIAALGAADSVERGWLELIRARMAGENVGGEAAWDHAELAREIFRRFRLPAGEAEALAEMGISAALTGRLSPDGTLAFRRFFASALALLSSHPNPLLAAKIHLNSAAIIGHGFGEIDESWEHLRSVERSAQAMADPAIRASFHHARAWVELTVGPDYIGAEADLVEAERIARKIHDARVLGNALYLRSIPARHQGRYAEGARYLREAGSEMESVGLTAFAFEAYAIASLHYLVTSDWNGYRETETILHSPRLDEGRKGNDLRWLIHQGLDGLIELDVDRFEDHFHEFFYRVKELPASSYGQTGLWWGHFLYAVGLRALGRPGDAADHIGQAEALLKSFNNRLGQDLIRSDFGDRMVQTLRDVMTSTRSPHRDSRPAPGRGRPTPSTSRRNSGRQAAEQVP